MNRYQIEVARLAEKLGITAEYVDDTDCCELWKDGVPIAAAFWDGSLEKNSEVPKEPGIKKTMKKLRRISADVDKLLLAYCLW